MKRKICILLLCLFCCLSFGALTGCAGGGNKTNAYTVTAVFSETDMSVSLDMEVTYYNRTGADLDHLCFNVFSNAYRMAAAHFPISPQKLAATFPNGVGFGGFSMERAEVNGKQTTYLLSGEDETLLTLRIPTLKNGDQCKVRIQGTVKLANACHRLGYGDDTVNLGNFLPTLCVYENGGFTECPYYDKGDPFFSETANYKVTFTAPKEYVVAYGGTCTKVEQGAENTTYVFALNNARDFALSLSKDYQVETQTVNGVEVAYYHIGDADAKRHLTVAAESFAFYEKKFGAYPYPRLAVCQSNFTEGGMEYPALCTVSTEVPGEEAPRVIAHEVAHQWWYAAVGVNQVEEGFLDESLAEYSTLLYLDAYPSYGFTRKGLVNSAVTAYSLYCDAYSQLVGKTDTSMKRRLSSFRSEYEYVNLAYNKGLIMWEYYRNAVGDARFYKGLAQFYKKYRLKTATAEDLYAVMDQAGGGEGLLRSFVEGTAVL